MKQSRKSVLNIKAGQKRIQRLVKSGLHPQALSQLQSNLSVFYSKHGKKQPTNVSGISLRGLNTSQINELKKDTNLMQLFFLTKGETKVEPIIKKTINVILLITFFVFYLTFIS